MVLAASAAVGEDGPMSLLRRVVRPMLAAPFIIDGLDAVLHPSRHVEKLERVLPTLEKAGAPPVLTSDAVMLTRATGAVSVAAGIGLATGAAPRSSAVVLAALNLPLTLAGAQEMREVNSGAEAAIITALSVSGQSVHLDWVNQEAPGDQNCHLCSTGIGHLDLTWTGSGFSTSNFVIDH